MWREVWHRAAPAGQAAATGTGRLPGAARRGAYPVGYEIDDSARTVTVVRLDHRGNVYRSR
ncbi:MAG TPA: hypothetical protein VJ757_10715 [Pseudonocardiaceae bacterium]|nr:hypothetical protein [Pseudonocardiaceae bacterium]